MMHARNFGSSLTTFLKFCTMKDIKSYMEIILKTLILGTKMVHPHNSGSTLRIFLKFCTVKGTKRYMKISLTIFPKKNFMSKWTILNQKMIWLYNSGFTFRFLIWQNKRGRKVQETWNIVFFLNSWFG